MTEIEAFIEKFKAGVLPIYSQLPFYIDTRISRHGFNNGGFMVICVVLSSGDDATAQTIIDIFNSFVLSFSPSFPLESVRFNITVLNPSESDIAA